MNKPVIAYYSEQYFRKTETFLYNYVSRLSAYKPVFLAAKFDNADQFPVPAGDCHRVGHFFKYLNYDLVRDLIGADIKAVRVIKQSNAKLIHAHFGGSGILARRLKLRTKLPLVTSFYGYDMSVMFREKRWQSKYCDLFSVGDLFLVEGEHMRMKLVEQNCPGNKIQIQRIAIPVQEITYRPRSAHDGQAILLFCGRLVEKKGLTYLLKAVQKVRRSNNWQFELRIAGEGPLWRETEEFISTENMGEYVKMLGHLSYEAYLREMNKADIFVQPSVTSRDGDSEGGAPTVILEAQASGMPVISTYHADIPNIVVPDRSALLSDEKNVERLTEHILHLLDHPEKWERMGHAGRKFVEENHDIEKEVKSLEEKYRSLIGR